MLYSYSVADAPERVPGRTSSAELYYEERKKQKKN